MGSVTALDGVARRGGDVPWMDPYKIVIVGLDEPETASNWFAFCPRVKEALDEEFVNSVRQDGVRQPVDVYRDGNRAVLLAGRRRVRAARIVYEEQKAAGKPEAERITVRFIVRQGEPADLFRVNVSENADRENLSPVQRAKLMLQHQKYGGDEEAIAKAFNCTTRTVRNTLAVLDLDPDGQAAVASGEIPARLAPKLAKMPREKQRKAREQMKLAGATKGAAAENALRAIEKGKPVVKDERRVRSRRRFDLGIEALLSIQSARDLSAGEKAAVRATIEALEWAVGNDDALPKGIIRDALTK